MTVAFFPVANNKQVIIDSVVGIKNDKFRIYITLADGKVTILRRDLYLDRYTVKD